MKKLFFLAYSMWIVPVYGQSVLPAPKLLYPTASFPTISRPYKIYWTKTKNATGYNLQIYKNQNFDTSLSSDQIVDVTVSDTTFTLNIQDSTIPILIGGFIRICSSQNNIRQTCTIPFQLTIVSYNAIDKDQTKSDDMLSVYPNPFQEHLTIEYDLAKPQFIEIAVYNLLGQKIEQLYNGYKYKGKFQHLWINQIHYNGIYILKIKGASVNQTKLIIAKK